MDPVPTLHAHCLEQYIYKAVSCVLIVVTGVLFSRLLY